MSDSDHHAEEQAWRKDFWEIITRGVRQWPAWIGGPVMSVIAFAAQLAGVQNMPRWFVAGVGVVAWIAIATFCIWREDKKKLTLSLLENKKFRDRAKDDSRREAVRVNLGRLLNEGTNLYKQCREEIQDWSMINESVPLATSALRSQWDKKAQLYLHSALGESFVARFVNPIGLTAPNDIACGPFDESPHPIGEQMHARLMRLHGFLSNQENWPTPMPNPITMPPSQAPDQAGERHPPAS